MPDAIDFAAALRLFDETTAALAARIQRLEGVLTAKQAELTEANRQLKTKVDELDRLSLWLELVMGAVASGVMAVDRRGHITTCNAAATVALRPLCKDPVGRDYRTLFPDSPLLLVIAGEEGAIRYEREIAGPKGRLRHVAQVAPLKTPAGELIGAVEVFDDVTEVRLLQERAERADRLKQLGELAAGVAHEIRNPLNGIRGFASLLLRDLDTVDPRRRHVQRISDAVTDLERTVSGLLEFTRPRLPERRTLRLHDLAAEVCALVLAEPARDADGVAIELVADASAPAISADPAQIRQVLLNLVQNAVQAVAGAREAPGGLVRVAVEVSADGQRLVVDDDGPGIPPEDRQRVFTPFFSTKDHGTGLGLAVSHALVNLHGGSITVADGPLGGARFTVTLPAEG